METCEGANGKANIDSAADFEAASTVTKDLGFVASSLNFYYVNTSILPGDTCYLVSSRSKKGIPRTVHGGSRAIDIKRRGQVDAWRQIMPHLPLHRRALDLSDVTSCRS